MRLVLLLVGLLATAFVLVHVGAHATIVSATQALGWRFVLVCLCAALITAVDSLGWRYAFARDRAPFVRLMAARVAGEALNTVTALASVGGEAVKAWLIRSHVPYQESIPSLIIGKTTMTIAQAVFLAFGLVVAWNLIPHDSKLLRAMLWLLLAEIIGGAGFVLVQITGTVGALGRLAARLGFLRALSHVQSIDSALRHFYRNEWRRLLLSIGWFVAGWLLGVVETMLVLHALHVPVSFGTATVIEALGSAVRFATFFVPGSLGAMEGANAAAFAALGLGASTGLAFSLVLRARQVIWILLGFLVLAASRTGARQPERVTG